jgi:hypothetical protein
MVNLCLCRVPSALQTHEHRPRLLSVWEGLVVDLCVKLKSVIRGGGATEERSG